MSIKVRDCRRPGHFWADNELLDVYGPKIGMDGLAVYMALSRVASNRTGECVITLRQIGEMVACSPQTAMRAIEKLSRYKLVRIESKGSVATRQPSVYTLLEVPKFPVPIGNIEDTASVPLSVPLSVPSFVPIGNTIKTINTDNTDNTGVGLELMTSKKEIPVAFSLTPIEDNLKPKQKAFQLPEWVPADAWAGFCEMRRLKKKPMTNRAKQIIVDELKKLKMEGFDPKEVLTQSEVHGWDKVYPIKENQNSSNGYRAAQSLPEEAEDDLTRKRNKEKQRQAKGGAA